MISRETVGAAYQWLLGRPPEDEDAIAYHMRHPDAAALRGEILRSAEFSALYQQLDHEAGLFSGRGAPLPEPAHVEWRAEPDERARLLARVAGAWAEMGADRAHWSVLTFDAFAPERLEENRAAFEATAEIDAAFVRAALKRFPGADPAGMDCVELGCGVGRATRALAGVFRHITGLDVSAPHLEIAARDLAAAGAGNVTLRRTGSVEEYAEIPEAAFFYSRLVLQHNPPPVQAEILRRILGRLTPGGIALFQVVTHIEGYRYSVAEDLEGKGGMEMHVLPQRAVFAILAECGFMPVEVQDDGGAGTDPRMRSHLFLAHKGPAGN